jgi:hypothetical protein
MQEELTRQYFRHLKKRRDRYQRQPFSVLLHSERNLQRRSLLQAWFGAEILRGALWGKTVPMHGLIAVWDQMRALCSAVPEYPFAMGDTTPGQLKSALSSDDQSCADGHLAIRDVAEGFAKYREFWQLSATMGVAQARMVVLAPSDGIYAVAPNFIASMLGLKQSLHPFCGALMDVAMLAFEDPFMAGSDTELVWEHMHPGLRLEQVVRTMARKKSAPPTTAGDCYGEALRAFGLDRSLTATATRWLEKSRANAPPEHPQMFPIAKDIHTHQREVILAAFQLRSDYPGIYFNSSNVPEAARTTFRDVCRPAIIIGSGSIFVPWGWSRTGTTVLLNLLQGFYAILAEEIAHEGGLDDTIQYSKMARIYVDRFVGNAARDLFDKDWTRVQVANSYGNAAARMLLSDWGDE